ncbi:MULTISPECIES: type II and III secretion system protein family protein [unclassified Sphingomonas]|uniref:type II and III secretion system protein family protein n=1 Tax=unclassified Sphingomonas TaxID=196159 RepID=UPI001047E020|nr:MULTISPECIES: type II and III secretion system protein family protein [unclassified Sphingomonas]TCP99988.1 pilus assembly protein CpaC [Sphingomonas sp. PP-F2F-A104-K0414]TCQ10715.1 pilus assembly protein CpaC [Sphingomonas sp. PP-CC-3A-396]
MRIRMTPLGWPLAVALAAASAAPSAPALAQRRGAAIAPAGSPVVQVNTGRGRLVTLARPMTDLFVADDSIADVQVRSPTQLYLFGKKTGETTISATTKGGAVVYAATVRVGNNLDSVQQMLGLAMPEAQVVATPMNGLILLTGTVLAPEDAAEAERLVQAFVGDTTKVLSRLKTATPLQVNLQVRVAEVSRSFVKNIGVNLLTQDRSGSGILFGSTSGTPGTITYDPTTGLKTSTYTKGAQRTTLGIAGKLLGMDFLTAIDLGEATGQVTTLANPNLTALSGETGTFLAGGEVPIPLAQALGTVSVEYKQYGISLAYTPTVLSDGRISLRVRPEVSQLDYSNAVTLSGTRVPGLTTRRTETTVELGSGQSMMISGLLSNSHNNSYDKTPGLSNLPIIGALFRSNAFQRNETELVIVITPYLVKPVNNASDIALPTDGARAPTDLDRVLLGTLSASGGGKRPVPTVAPASYAQPSVGAAAVVRPTPLGGDVRRPEDDVVPPTTRNTGGKAKNGSVPAPGFSN